MADKLSRLFKTGGFWTGLEKNIQKISKRLVLHSATLKTLHARDITLAKSNQELLEKVAALDKESRKIALLEQQNAALTRQVDRVEATMRELLLRSSAQLSPLKNDERVVSEVPKAALEQPEATSPAES